MGNGIVDVNEPDYTIPEHLEKKLPHFDAKDIDAAKDEIVNHPNHYKGENGIECIQAIRAALTYEEFEGYCKGNIFKYIWRAKKKGGLNDIAKAVKYAEFLIKGIK